MLHGAQSEAWLESRRHSKEAMPEPEPSLPLKEKLAAALLVSAAGWVVIWVSGAWVSTDQVKVAGV